MPSSLSRRTRSTLLSASTARRPLAFSLSMMRRVSRSSGRAASTSNTDPVGVGGAGPGGRDHRAVEAAARLEDAGRIDEDQLRRPAIAMPSSRVRVVCTFGVTIASLRADELVQQCRFAGIRRADQRDIAAARRIGTCRLRAAPPSLRRPLSRHCGRGIVWRRERRFRRISSNPMLACRRCRSAAPAAPPRRRSRRRASTTPWRSPRHARRRAPRP